MRYETASPDIYPLLRAFARENRKNATVAEQVLWEHIRHDALGVKIQRQHIIGDFIVDFLAPNERLIIEVDGAYHAEERQKEDDKMRAEILERKGYKVIRFSNEEVLYDTDMTIKKIKEALKHE
ncbi:MAG: endonuclease domain-containing protein [Bacteroidaceae bacterium]|nr:endonuclease domain-containing protein [Bacteroidaceae bacterium]